MPTTNNTKKKTTAPTVRSVLAEVERLREQLIANSNGHTEAGQALSRRLDLIEKLTKAMPDPEYVEQRTAELAEITSIIDRLTAVEAKADEAHVRIDAITNPKAKGSLPRATKGVQKAHVRISELGEAVFLKIADLQEQITKASATGGQKGIIMTLRQAKVDDAVIRDVLGLVGDGELDLDNDAFIAEWFTAYQIHLGLIDDRLKGLDEKTDKLGGRVKALEDANGEIRASVAAIASATGSSRGKPRWGLGVTLSVIFAAIAWSVMYWMKDYSFGWSLFVTAVVGVASFWLGSSFEKEGSAPSAFAAGYASARSSKKSPAPAVGATTAPTTPVNVTQVNPAPAGQAS